MNIKELNKEIKNCNKCRLSETRKNALCGEGNLDAELMFIAQAPGYNEDSKGKMFIGPSGKVLDELFEISKIKRQEIYITNLIKCLLPKYRRPKQDEIISCSKYVDEEIALIKPRIIIPLGYYATRYIFERYDILMPQKPERHNVFGKKFFSADKIIFPLQHPAVILHNNSLKTEIIKNYCKINQIDNINE